MNGLLIGILIGLGLGYWVVTWWQRRAPKYLAVAEYWVYLPGQKLPKQDEVMSLVLSGNSPIGPQEGLLFSDIRLHVGLVLRSRNPHVFRPDLLEDHLEPTAEQLERLSESQAVAKIRYLSEEKLKTDTHLQLLPYMAYAYCKLGQGKAVYDVSAERLMTTEELQSQLRDRNARRPDLHLNIIWRRGVEGGRAETRGLIKKGIPELVTAEVHTDERLLVTSLLEEAAKQVWIADQFPEKVEVESYNDLFRLLLGTPKDGKSEVRILRVQGV
jgi:hypothetical protein